jgi:hypothetical protein
MAVTIHEMTKTPFVLGVFSRLKAAGLALSDFYGIGPGKAPTEVSPRRSLVYDIYNTTRTMTHARSPYVGPGKSSPQKIGQSTAHALRLYEAIPLMYEKIFQTRPLGAQIGEIDATGQAYIARQQKYLAQRFMNAMEFMVSRMFRGGFSILIDGDDWKLREKGSGTVDVEYNLPAAHKSQLAVGGAAGSSDVIDASWDDPTTNIVQQLLNLNKASERISGYVQKHIWINSTTYGQLLNNEQLRDIRGTANRIFDSQTGRTIKTTEDARESGFQVIFGAIPQFTFHIYDAVSHVTVDKDSTTASELSLYIPDNIALITPEPEMGGWYGLATCTEPIRENDISDVIYPNGLHSWSYPTNDPPGFEQRVIWNGVPLLYNPYAHFYATVIF